MNIIENLSGNLIEKNVDVNSMKKEEVKVEAGNREILYENVNKIGRLILIFENKFSNFYWNYVFEKT